MDSKNFIWTWQQPLIKKSIKEDDSSILKFELSRPQNISILTRSNYKIKIYLMLR
jgi:hypothetical protein